MNSKTACFTGHRVIPASEYTSIQKRLEDEIINLIHQGVTEFRTGGALGFDTIAALTILRLKKQFPHIRLILVLPYWEQPNGWSVNDQEQYAIIRVKADEVIYTSWLYHRGCMQKRNRRLVDNSNYCICYLTKNSGGTKYTVDYAIKKELKIIES